MQHVALQIIRGVFTVDQIGSTDQRYEAPIQAIDLLNAGGFSVGDSGWIPGIPGIKNGGIRIDNPLRAGSEILAAVDGNVTETMRLNATEVDRELRYSLLRKLALFRKYALDVQTGGEFEPVYLLWQAPGAPGPQYAVIINIEIAGETDPFAEGNYQELTITVEREPYWRSIPPGVANLAPFVYPGLNQSVYNYTLQSLDNDDPPIGDCRAAYIDIPAEDIPGDAPALVNIRVPNYYEGGGMGFDAAPAITSVMAARYTRPLSYTYEVSSSPGTYRKVVHTNTLLAAPQAVNPPVAGSANIDPYNTRYASGVATVADAGARGRKATCADANAELAAEISFSSTDDLMRITWTIGATVMTGTYLVFLRGGQRGGSLGDTRMYLKYGFYGDDAQTESVRPELTPAAPTEYWPVNYLGTISIPTGNRKVLMGQSGITPTPSADFSINLWASRSTGSSTLRVQDLILMPIDECNINIIPGLETAQDLDVLEYDNTGESLHGGLGETVYSGNGSPELQGSEFTLRPGVTNRIYFFWQSSEKYDGANFITPTRGFSSVVLDPDGFYERDAEVNIGVSYIPRWVGVRDV